MAGVWLSVAACSGGHNKTYVTDTQALDIADAYVAKNYPMSPRHRLQPIAHDQGDTWLVTYTAPENSVGGTPTIQIDKSSSRVVYATMGQ